MAIGSLAIGFCNAIRLTLYYIDLFDLRKHIALDRLMMSSMHFFTWCIQRYFDSMTRNAYIRCAIHDKPFCISSRDAVELMMRNFLRVFALQRTTTFLFLLAKVLVTAACGTVAYLIFGNSSIERQRDFVPVPVFLVCIASYFVASLFFDVYSAAVDTLMLCFCTYSGLMRLKQN